MNANEILLKLFIDGQFPRLSCPQCENTFLTNVYSVDCATGNRVLSLQCERCKERLLHDAPENTEYVLLEKRSLALEYFCDAMTRYQLTQIPYTRRVGVLSDEDEILPFSSVKLFTDEEPDFRIIYIMERLEHLDAGDVEFFSENIYGFDWQDEQVRHQLIDKIAEKYNHKLAEDVRLLCRYFREHEDFVSWDLHGDNLMRRPSTGEVVVLDPFVARV